MARAPVKRFFGTLLFLIGLVLFFGFLFILFADAENLGSVPFVEQTDIVARVVGVALGLIIIVLAIMVLVRAARPDEDDEDMFFIPEKDQVRLAYGLDEEEDEEEDLGPAGIDFEVYNLPNVSRQPHAWEKPEQKGTVYPYHFPRSVEKGLYANDYITIDADGTRIKLRTLIAGPKGAQRGELPRVTKRHLERLKIEEEEKHLAAQAAELRGEEVEPGDGAAFMEELERRSEGPQADATQDDVEEVYFGYGGDNPALSELGSLDADALAALEDAGVTTTTRLLFEDPARLARETGFATADVTRWQAIAELQKVPGLGPQEAVVLSDVGVRGIGDLKKADPERVAEHTHGALRPASVRAWKEAAEAMQRTKQRVPAS